MISKLIHLWVFALFFNLKCIPASETYKSIMWDPQNPLFVDGKSNCDPAYKYKILKIRSASKVKFICPNVAMVLQTTQNEVSKSNKYENLWLLYNRTSFDKCDTKLDPKAKKPLLRCLEPTELEFHSITFQKYAAEPNELTFQKGESYFFIATSNGLISHINDTSGGHCNDSIKKVYMKIEVYVCNDTDQGEDPKCMTGVGKLTCPKEKTVSSSTTPTPTHSSVPATISSAPSSGGGGGVSTVIYTTCTTATYTYMVTTTVPTNKSENKEPNSPAERKALTGDSNACKENAWMAVALAFIVVCIAFVVIFIIYYFCCPGSRKRCPSYETKVTPELGKKNIGFKHDSLDNRHSFGVPIDTGSLPDKDVVLYNQEVFYNNTATVDEENKKNAPT